MKTELFRKDWKFLAEKYFLRKHPEFEPEVRRALKSFSCDLAVDVGANMGVHTRLLARRFKTVYAIEPSPKALAVLYMRKPENVKVFEMALSSQVGTTEFFTDRHPVTTSPADTILPTFKYNPSPSRKGWPSGEAHTYHGEKGLTVKTTTFDTILGERIVDLVLIDVEGAEFVVLEGMKTSINKGRVRAALVELHDIDRRTELEQLFPGYVLQWIDPDHLLATERENSAILHGG